MGDFSIEVILLATEMKIESGTLATFAPRQG